MNIVPIKEVIPESNIVVFAPHFDDFLLMLGGYVLELKENNLLATKKFHINIIFSRSNYLAGTGNNNYDASLDRIKLATGKRLLEDVECLDELLGELNYRYELIGEGECFTRSKTFADSEMEFPHGMYEDFSSMDERVFARTQALIKRWSLEKDTALVFPIAFKEHIDHFIVREAGIKTAKELGDKSVAKFYFQEDKPYAGIASDAELGRIEDFIKDNELKQKLYKHHPEKMIELAFKHYVSQVEEIYKIGIRKRCEYFDKMYDVDYPVDRILVYKKELFEKLLRILSFVFKVKARRSTTKGAKLK